MNMVFGIQCVETHLDTLESGVGGGDVISFPSSSVYYQVFLISYVCEYLSTAPPSLLLCGSTRTSFSSPQLGDGVSVSTIHGVTV